MSVTRAVMRAIARVNLCSNCCDCNRCLERERSVMIVSLSWPHFMLEVVRRRERMLSVFSSLFCLQEGKEANKDFLRGFLRLSQLPELSLLEPITLRVCTVRKSPGKDFGNEGKSLELTTCILV